MIRRVLTALGGVFVLALAACDPKPTSVAESKPKDATVNTYDGPPISLRVLMLQTYPGQYVASTEMTVPTGGWSLQLDKSEVTDGKVRLYFTLEKPAKGEMVIQSLATLTQSYKTTTPFDKAEAWVFVAERGISYLTASYKLAAVSKP